MKTKSLLLALFSVICLYATGQYKAIENFDSYNDGTINEQGSVIDGWAGAWNLQSGEAVLEAGAPSGKALKASGDPLNSSNLMLFRSLDSLYPGNAKNGVYWVAFDFKFNSFRTNADATSGLPGITDAWPSDGWGGFSLYRDDNELLYIGKTSDGVGIDPGGNPTKAAYSDPATLSHWMVVRIENRWDETLKDYLDPRIDLWLDPIDRDLLNDDGTEPDTALKDISFLTDKLRGGFNKIRIASASELSLSYDNIRIGRSFAAVNYQTTIQEPVYEDLIIQDKIVDTDIPPRAFDLFDGYEAFSSLDGQGEAGADGWRTAWEADGNSAFIIDQNLDGTAGKHVELVSETGDNKNFRTLSKKYENVAGRSYWLGFNFQYNLAPGKDHGTWAGVSLFDGNSELFFAGHPYGDTTMGVANVGKSATNFDNMAWMVIRIDMQGAGLLDGDPIIYCWINPDTLSEPDIATAPIIGIASGLKPGFDRVRIAGSTDKGIMLVDKLAIGTQFSHLYNFSSGPGPNGSGYPSIKENLSITPMGNEMVRISDIQGKSLAIYSLDGRLIMKQNKVTSPETIVSLKRGLYIIKVNHVAQKIVVE